MADAKSGLLGQRDVQLIVGAVGISALGDFLLWVPLTLHLQEMTDSGIAVAALFVALWTPVVVLAPVAGLLADRFEARGILLVASLAQLVIAAAMAFALDSAAAILVLATLLGVGFAFAQPAEFALVPVIGGGSGVGSTEPPRSEGAGSAGAEAGTRLTEVNGYVESARYAGMMTGPVIGGVLAGLGSTEVAMLVNAGTFGVVAVSALLLRARRRPEPSAEGAGPERARDGIVFLFRDRTLTLVLSVAFVSLLFMSASVTAEVFFLKEDLEVSDTVYGLIFACWMIGMVTGALVVARRVPIASLALVALIAVGVQGAGLGLPTVWLAVAFGGAMWFVGGLGHGTKNVLVRTLIQQQVPDRLHGRAFAAYNGLRNGAELVALAAGGLLVAAIGGRPTLALAGSIPVLAAIAGLVFYRRPRADEGAPEPRPELADVGISAAETSPAAPGVAASD
jgi:MFS family permease